MSQNHSNRGNVELAQKKHVDQWSKIEDTKVNICNVSHFIFDKDTRNMVSKKMSLTNVSEKTGYPHGR